MRKALVAFAAAVVSAAAVSFAAAQWIIPVVDVVGFEYNGGEYINVSFDINNSADGYSDLNVADEKVSQSLAESYVPDAGVCSTYDFDARSRYAFDGWYTSPDGGQKIGEDCTLLQAAEGADSVTLYAHWISKCRLDITINDSCFSQVDGSCTLFWYDENGSEASAVCNSSQTGTFNFTFYINPSQEWKIVSSTLSGEKVLSGVRTEYGKSYSFEIKVYVTGLISVPSSLTAA